MFYGDEVRPAATEGFYFFWSSSCWTHWRRTLCLHCVLCLQYVWGKLLSCLLSIHIKGRIIFLHEYFCIYPPAKSFFPFNLISYFLFCLPIALCISELKNLVGADSRPCFPPRVCEVFSGEQSVRHPASSAQLKQTEHMECHFSQYCINTYGKEINMWGNNFGLLLDA